MRFFKTVLVVLTVIPSSLYSQMISSRIQEGNDYYKQQQYEKAIDAYERALNLDPMNNTAKFNNANCLVKLGNNGEAIKLYENILMNTSDAELKGKVYYNMGVIFSSEKQLEASIEAYKNALRHNPNDTEARENLQKALQELKQKTPPPPKQDKKKQQQQQQPQQQKMDMKEVEQRLKLLEQKEKEVMQKTKRESRTGNQQKDW